jgi:hypothetical protein
MTCCLRPLVLVPMLAFAGTGCGAGHEDTHHDAGPEAHGVGHHPDPDPEVRGAHQAGHAGHDAEHVAHRGQVRTRDTRIRLHRESARAFTIELTPIPLPAGGGEAHVMPVTPLLAITIPLDAMLTSFEVELTDGAGNRMPQDVLHHVNVMLPDRRDLFRPVMQRLVAAGEETDPIGLPWPLGFPVKAGEQLLAYAMLHNGSDTDYGDVTLRLHFGYSRGTRRTAVQPFFIDASPPPGPASWDLPPGRSVRQWEGSPAVSGRILGLGGHLHRYGTELILEDVTARRVMFRTQPQVDAAGNVVAMPHRRFLARLGVPIRTGHVYRITAVYHNPTDRTIRDGAMGAIGGIIRVRGNAWPAADTAHPLYREDVAILTGMEESHAHH